MKYEDEPILAHPCYMAKKICISREAHARLKDRRREGETFTEVILRVTDRPRDETSEG